ncbi:hypothetical protein, partial [Rariglobus hedericola]
FIEPKKYSIYPLSERAMPLMQTSTERKIVAADYITGIKIKTGNPDAAAQMILGQISDATKRKLAPFWNSRLKEAKPSIILSGIGKNSVWSIFISPADGGDYIVTISYVIEEETEANQALQTTTTAVTDRAVARSAPAAVVSDL